MALNISGNVSSIKHERKTTKDNIEYDAYKVVVATKNQDGSAKFYDLPVYITKNVDTNILKESPISITNAWLSTNGETLSLVVNGVERVEKKA